MRTHSMGVIHCSALIFVLLALVAAAFANDGRDFAGSYSITNIDPAMTQSSFGRTGNSDRAAANNLTMTVRVFNLGETGIKQPRFLLIESGPSHLPIGEFTSLNVFPAKSEIILTGQFVVSGAEVKNWSNRRASPKVVVLYTDVNGRSVRQNVQLSRQRLPANASGE